MNKVTLILAAAAAAVGVALVVYLNWGGPAADAQGPAVSEKEQKEREKTAAEPGKTVTQEQATQPLKPKEKPKPVGDPDRFKQNLQPGKTYEVRLRGTAQARGEDTAWGVKTEITIVYAFEADIDREVISNDGKTVVEVRHFKRVASTKFDCTVEDVRLELPEFARAFLPDNLHGLSAKDYLGTVRMLGIKPEDLTGHGKKAEVFTRIDGLHGKSVRLKYQDGQGVLEVTAVKGSITNAERDFHLGSSVVSDSLIFPNVKIDVGKRWEVDGSNFSNFIDPSFQARPSGDITLKRAENLLVGGEDCLVAEAVDGRLRLDDTTAREFRVGYFDPRGKMKYSPEKGVFVEGTLKGRGALERMSRDHLLFPTRFTRQPDIEIKYQCAVRDTIPGKDK